MEARLAGADDLRKLAKDLKAAGKGDLRKSMTKRLRATVQPIVPEMRRKIKALPGAGGEDRRSKKAKELRPRGLHDATARGVQAKVSVAGPKVGVRIRIDPRLFPDGQKNLPRYLDGALPRWRHETYGHEPWVTQESHEFFEPTIRPHRARVEADVIKVLDDVRDELARG
jgi:hypothetical protein